MRRQQEHREQGILVAEGEKVVRRLLQSEFEVISLLFPEKWLESFEPLARARVEEVGVYLAEKPVLEELTGFTFYQGVLAVGRIPRRRALEELLSSCPQPALLVAVDGLTSAENLGGLVRNCAAFGVHGLIVGETSSSPYLRRAVRSSMGTIFRLPVVEPDSLAVALHKLRGQGLRCIAAHPRSGAVSIDSSDFTRDCCIVFGSEGYGISTGVLDACDEQVRIPMAPQVNSLNVGHCSAVFLYEAARQRKK